MTAAAIETAAAPPIAPPVGDPEDFAPATDETAIMDEARIGIETLRTMSPDELRAVIASRAEMLNTVLREREDRRAAIQTARLAGKLYDIRHLRARRIYRQVNIGSVIAAMLCTAYIATSIV